jgi:branched-chain amino acid transport system permease protein
MTAYLASVVVFVGIFVILAWTYDLLLGRVGLFSVAHIAFYAIGAYTVALLMLHWSFPFFAAVVAAMAVNAVISFLLGYFTTRLVGDYLVVATLGLHYIVVSGILPNWQDVTGGYFGVFNIPKPMLFGWELDDPWEFALLTSSLTVLCGLLFHQLGRSRLGLAWRAVRDDEIGAMTLGYPVAALKTVAFMIASSMVVLAGALYASFIGYIDPPTFELPLVILVIAMVVVGGSGTILGPVVGALLLIALPDMIVFLSRSSSQTIAPIREIVYGLALVGFAMFRPAGIVRATLPQWTKQLERNRNG